MNIYYSIQWPKNIQKELKRGNVGGALAIMDKELSQDPTSESLLYQKAVLLHLNLKPEESIQILDHILTLNPSPWMP